MTGQLHPSALRVLQAIAAAWRERGLPPTRREIAARCGFRSSQTAQYWLAELAEAGLVEVGEHEARAVRLTARALEILPEGDDA